jgi:hypothetical protein
VGRQACDKSLFMWFTNATNKNTLRWKDKILHQHQKKLILNMDDLGIFIDNIEGLTLVQNWLMANSLCFCFW